MKKVKTILKWVFWPLTFATTAVGTSMFNAYMLVKWHDVDYYFTPSGIKLFAILLGVELVLMLAFAWAIDVAYFSKKVPDDEERE